MTLEEWDTWLMIGANLATFATLPLAVWGIVTYIREKGKEHADEEDETYRELSEAYQQFLREILKYPRVWSTPSITDDEELEARRHILFEMLISLFEHAHILLFAEEQPTPTIVKMRATWEDWMRFWCAREDFRALLPRLLEGEDPDFARFIRGIADQQSGGPRPDSASR